MNPHHNPYSLSPTLKVAFPARAKNVFSPIQNADLSAVIPMRSQLEESRTPLPFSRPKCHQIPKEVATPSRLRLRLNTDIERNLGLPP